jgi:2-ketocyclohexanecarboxyl-CoA hydrolase
VHQTVSHCPKPVIARVNGYCIGGANHLAYFCDFTIAAEHAIFGQNGPRVGSPACGAIVSYLTRVIGAKRAREMWMLSRRYSAAQALDMGLVNVVVPLAKLDEEVDKWCRELLALSPTCLKILKASFVEEFSYLFGQGDQLRRYMTTPGSGRSSRKARAFLEKRAPDFSGSGAGEDLRARPRHSLHRRGSEAVSLYDRSRTNQTITKRDKQSETCIPCIGCRVDFQMIA